MIPTFSAECVVANPHATDTAAITMVPAEMHSTATAFARSPLYICPSPGSSAESAAAKNGLRRCTGATPEAPRFPVEAAVVTGPSGIERLRRSSQTLELNLVDVALGGE